MFYTEGMVMKRLLITLGIIVVVLIGVVIVMTKVATAPEATPAATHLPM